MTELVCNTDLLTARVYHGLKSLLTPGDTLPPRFLEYSICKAFDMVHVGDGNFYADGVKDDVQASIKTRMITPLIRKKTSGKNFFTRPELFLGPHHNQKHNRWTGGLEIVQRRQALPFDDIAASPEQIGTATLQEFAANVTESAVRYNTTHSIEIVCVHGYDCQFDNYLVGLYWQPYQHLTADTMVWTREGSAVAGYATVNGVKHKLVDRINGNAKREATCFKEYKNLLKYQNSLNIQVPVPEPWAFDQCNILAEIQNLKENRHVTFLFQ